MQILFGMCLGVKFPKVQRVNIAVQYQRIIVFSTLCYKPQKERRGHPRLSFCSLRSPNTTYLFGVFRNYNPRKVSRGSKLHNDTVDQQKRPTYQTTCYTSILAISLSLFVRSAFDAFADDAPRSARVLPRSAKAARRIYSTTYK